MSPSFPAAPREAVPAEPPPARGVADAHAALSVAFGLLSPEDQAADLVEATIGLAKLPPALGAAPGETEPDEGANL
ncbi:MAG: hypothetical protein U1E95_05345 [Rubrivivax sp.]